MMMHPSAAAALALALLLGVSSAAAAAAAAAAAGSIELVESSEAGAHWKAMPPLSWTDDFAADVEVTAQLEQKKQTVMGFGSAMTDTSAYNAMVWMDDKTRDGFFEALWGKSGLGLSIGRVTLNSADYSFQSFNCAPLSRRASSLPPALEHALTSCVTGPVHRRQRDGRLRPRALRPYAGL